MPGNTTVASGPQALPPRDSSAFTIQWPRAAWNRLVRTRSNVGPTVLWSDTPPPDLDGRSLVLFNYWRQARGDDILPDRAGISPARLKPILTIIVLLEALDGGRDYRFRLAGEHFETRVGQSVRGRRLSEIAAPAYLKSALATGRMVIETRRPILWRGGFDTFGVAGHCFEKLAVPYGGGADRETASFILTSFAFES